MRAELAQDSLHVGPERRARDPELVGSLARRGALGEELEHLELARGERFQRTRPRLALEEQPLQLARREEDLADRGSPHAVDDLVERPVLGGMPDRAGTR